MVVHLKKVGVSGSMYWLVISSPALILVLARISTQWSDITVLLVLFLSIEYQN